MKILLIDNGTSYLKHIQELLLDHNVDTYNFAEIPETYQNYNAVILSGGHSLLINAENEKLLDREIELIRNFKKPILGICYGAELIAFTYESTLVEKIPSKEILAIEKLQDDPIFNNIEYPIVFGNHRFYIDTLGAGLQILAESEGGIEIFKHKEYPHYRFQFHPEKFPDETMGDELFRNFLNLSENTIIKSE